jgi:hypothetical protein
MVLFELGEDDRASDFASVFPSVAEERREEEERRQTRMFLQILDGLEKREQHRGRRAPREEEEEEDAPRARRSARLRKELMRVSITDDDLQERTRAKDRAERERKVERVHTIKDLPPDEFDFFGQAALPEAPDIVVEAGRRLSDGRVAYHTRFPSLAGILEDLGLGFLGDFRFELVLLLVAMVFAMGVYLGRLLARASAARAAARAAASAAPQPIVYYAMPPGFAPQGLAPAPPQPAVAVCGRA